MDPPARKEKPKVKEPVSRIEKAKQKSAQQELKQRQFSSEERQRPREAGHRGIFEESRSSDRAGPTPSTQHRKGGGVAVTA